MGSSGYDVFISYSHLDDADGWVSGLRDAVYEDFRAFSSEPFRIFFDTKEIRSRQDWELRLREGLRSARVLLVCVSPNYLKSVYCAWEWTEFVRAQARRLGGGDAITGVYFVALGGDQDYDADVAEWRREVERVQFEQLQPWFPDGVIALQEAEVRKRIRALGQGVHDQVRQARLAKQAPGNLRRHNPFFEGRIDELRAMRTQLAGGAAGVVTAVHGLGGMGKTEVALTYAHMYAHAYQGGTWQVDCDGQTDVLQAMSSLALAPELDLAVGPSDLADRTLLGRRVLARLSDIAEAARTMDAESSACLVLLDNVSEPGLLSESQLSVLPEQPWLHLMATTRLGVNDVAAAGSRASVAMIEVGPLGVEDAVALIRDHQPARDAAHLNPDFSSPAEEAAARRIVELLDGYTLAVEQAAVYLGIPGTQPSGLLELLRTEGATLLDQVGSSAEGAAAIRHQQRMAGAIVDQTLARLPPRARAALAQASLLPPDTIPWFWLEQLTENPDSATSMGLPGLSGGDDWPATRRILVGRRLLTAADDPQFARLHRVLQEHLRTRLNNPDVERHLDDHLGRVANELHITARPDVALLAAAATTITTRLAAGRSNLATAGLLLSAQAQQRLDLTTTYTLANTTLTAWTTHANDAPNDLKRQRGLQIMLDRVGQLAAARGDAARARELYDESFERIERLATADPTNEDLQRDLAIGLERMGGNLYARGDAAGALCSFTQSLSIRERLAAASADDPDDQGSLVIGLNKVGETLANWGDADGALSYYVRSLAIAERLADAYPTEPQWQRYVAVSLTKVGDRLLARGDTSGALERYTRSLQIDEASVAADPTNTEWQRNVADGLRNIARILAAQGDPRGAFDRYSQALQIYEGMAASDPTNTGLQQGLSSSLTDVGDVLAKRGDIVGALDGYNRALRLAERLTTLDPSNTGWQRQLSVRLDRLANFANRSGDAEAALTYQMRSLNIMEELVDTEPLSTEFQRDLSTSLDRIGDDLADRGYPDAALVQYTQSLNIREQLAAMEPSNTGWQRNVAVSLDRVGAMLAAANEQDAALGRYMDALTIRRRIAVMDPTDTGLQRELASSLTTLGDFAASKGDSDAARTHHTEALAVREQLVALDPMNKQSQRDLSISLERIGAVLETDGNTADAANRYKRAMQIRTTLAEADPTNLQGQNDLWIIAFKAARALESLDDPTAADFWAKAHHTIAAQDAAGKMRETDRKFLDHFRNKLDGEEQ